MNINEAKDIANSETNLDEIVIEATKTVAFIRRLQLEETDIKESLKEKRAEIDQAHGSLLMLFEVDKNDAARPLFEVLAEDSNNENDIVPVHHTVTGEPGGKARRRKQ